MLKHFFNSCLLALTLCGCVTQPVADPVEPSELERVEKRIDTAVVKISKQIATNCDLNFKQLNSKIDDLKKAKTKTKIVERCPDKVDSKKRDDKLLLGAVERVRLSKEAVTLNARIDTGADTSSLGVYKLKTFERDGESWVRFALNNKDNARLYEYPVFDKVKIKQSGSITEDRIEIKMGIEMGGKKYRKQIFNLANRSYLDYRVLIGRSFLRDIAIVDVSRKYLLKAKK